MTILIPLILVEDEEKTFHQTMIFKNLYNNYFFPIFYFILKVLFLIKAFLWSGHVNICLKNVSENQQQHNNMYVLILYVDNNIVEFLQYKLQ